eukprot:262214_1
MFEKCIKLNINQNNLNIKIPTVIIRMFDHWCEQKRFLNFETFLYEKNKMHQNLQEIIYNEKNNSIRILHLKKLFPKINHYYDIDGTLKCIENVSKHINTNKPTSMSRRQSSVYNSQFMDISQEIVAILDELDFKFDFDENKSSNNKKHFIASHRKLLKNITTVIQRKDDITLEEIVHVIDSTGLFETVMSQRLAERLFAKILDDRERIKPWQCNHCCYVNGKIMVGGLFRLYQEISECGLCGSLRCGETDDTSRRIDVIEHKFNLPDSINSEWMKIESDAIFSLSCLSHNQFIYLLEKHLFGQIKDIKKRNLLIKHKDQIIGFFKENKMDGLEFREMGKKDFIKIAKQHCKIKHLNIPTLTKLYKTIKECNYDEIRDIPKDGDDVKVDAERNKKRIQWCSAMKRLNIILGYFNNLTDNLSDTDNKYPHTMHEFLSSLHNYEPENLLADTYHIARHKPSGICVHGINCKSFKRISRDRNEDETKKQSTFNTNNPNDYIYISMLDSAHNVYYHSSDHLKRRKSLKALSEDVSNIAKWKEQMPIYSTGVYINYLQTTPLHRNLKDEVTINQLTVKIFEYELQAAKIFMKAANITKQWTASRTDEKYGIHKGKPMQIEHILCIKLYCNHGDLCANFRESYRHVNPKDTDSTVIKRHIQKYYWFGRFLLTAIVFYGEPLNKKNKLYHGMSGKFKFDKFSSILETPTSTTYSYNSAANFIRDGVGIILQLSPRYKKEVSFSKCLDVESFSDFPEEKEILFAGMSALSITNIYSPSDNQFQGYSKYIKAILYLERITEQNIHQKRFYNHGVITDNNKDDWVGIQEQYLIPIINYQMHRYTESKEEMKETGIIPPYIALLVEHFCDKKEIINVSCIQYEIQFMIDALKLILFDKIPIKDNKIKYEINNQKLKLIFPHLKQYQHYAGYWVNLDATTQASVSHHSISKQQVQLMELNVSEQKRNTITGLAEELQVLQKLINAKEQSNHYYDYYIDAHDQWFTIINKNNFESSLASTNSQDIGKICDVYNCAIDNFNKLDELKENENVFDGKWRFTENLVEIQELDNNFYRKMRRNAEWNAGITSNELQDLIDFAKKRGKKRFSRIRQSKIIGEDELEELKSSQYYKSAKNAFDVTRGKKKSKTKKDDHWIKKKELDTVMAVQDKRRDSIKNLERRKIVKQRTSKKELDPVMAVQDDEDEGNISDLES